MVIEYYQVMVYQIIQPEFFQYNLELLHTNTMVIRILFPHNHLVLQFLPYLKKLQQSHALDLVLQVTL